MHCPAMILATVAALGLGVASAYAEEGDGTIPNTLTELPGVIAQPATGLDTAMAAANHGSVSAFVTHQSTGTWLFPSNRNEGANN